MRLFNVKIAGKVIKIKSNYSKIYHMCDTFMVKNDEDFEVEANDEDYLREASEFKRTNRQEPPSDVYLEPLVFLRKISNRFIDYDIFLMHGAAIVLNNEAFIFTAPSGTGKTTHILKWLEQCPGAYILNGDKPFILTCEEGQRPIVCGSPWSGKEELFTNAMVPLKAIIMMERNDDNYIEQVTFSNAFPTLLQQVYRPEDASKMRRTLQLLQRLKPTVEFWRFKCNNFKDDCFDTSYQALIKDRLKE